jgi:methylenetetrahydrofolate dehydrogenase (NADP+)/methenyltetrahydrofolate cyclohydrolase/formyltetrahydrofolate synthetase
MKSFIRWSGDKRYCATVSECVSAIQAPTGGRWSLRVLPLELLSPVPSDIAVSRAQRPKPIDILAREVGIFPAELDLYGRTKAKVSLDVIKRLAHINNGKYVVVTGTAATVSQ